MSDAPFLIAGGPGALADELASVLAVETVVGPHLVNADEWLDAAIVTARCRAFADLGQTRGDRLIVTILRQAPPGSNQADLCQAVAALWAFTRLAALEWAPRGIRVNAIGLTTSPAGPYEAQEEAGRAAFAMPSATPAPVADIARTIQAMVRWRSMTGQIIRLGV